MLAGTAAAMALAAVALTHASPLSLAPFYVPEAPAHDLLNSTYIVMFRDDIPADAFQAHLSFLQFANDVHPLHTDTDGESVSGVAHVYDSIVTKGYTGRFSNDAIEMIRRRPEVKYVEQDQLMRPDTLQVQADPTWVSTLFRQNFVLHFLYLM